MKTLERKIVLIVEDEIFFANTLSKKIEDFGFTPMLVHSGEEAISIISQNKGVKLILMDIDLGNGIDGIETAVHILKIQNLPIVFHSSHFERQVFDRIRNITRYGYVVKNSGDFILQSSIEMALDLFDLHEKNKNIFESQEKISNHTDLLLNRITDSVVSLDLEWKFIYLNNSAAVNFRKPKEEVIGKVIWEVFPETKDSEIWKKLHEAMDNQSPLEFETIYKPYDMWVWIRCYPSKDGMTLIFQNGSEAKQTEKRIKEATTLLDSVVENIPNMIFIKYAKDLRFALFNRAGEELLGYRREDLLGKNDYDFFPKEQADFFTQKDRDVLNKKELIDISEENIDTPLGTRILHTKKLALLDETGEPQYLLGISEDITERKKAEKELNQNIERYERIAATVPGALYDYIMHKDGSNQLLYISSKCKEIFELDVNVILEDMSVVLNMIHPEDVKRFQEENQAVNRLGTHFSSEVRIITPSGKEKWIQLTSRPNSQTKPDEPAVWSGIVIDITSRKLAEEKIKDLLQEKELLLKEVHHRIKNNMLTITSLLFLQIESLEEPAAIAALNDASSRIQSMLVLYDKLYRSTDFKELSIPEYLSSLVSEIVSNFPNNKIVKIEKSIDNFILPSSVLFPIGIMINEILTNAMKYAFIGRKEGQLVITAQKKADLVLFSLHDDGIGLPESIQFENSTGFGLQLVKMLAKQIKGMIRIERTNGTKFTLEFNLE